MPKKKEAKDTKEKAPKAKKSATKDKSESAVRLPAKLLNTWVDERMGWSEAEWQDLLAQLREKGHDALLYSADGIDRIKAHVTKRFQKGLKLPKKELNSWVKSRSAWNHDEWLGLLGDLTEKGYDELTTSEKGRNAIGQYIEAKASEANNALAASAN